MRKLLTLKEAGEVLSVSRDTLRRLIRRSEIASVRIGKKIMVSSEELDRIVRQGTGADGFRK